MSTGDIERAMDLGDDLGEARIAEVRPTVFVLIDNYLPGYKAGGPVQSLANVVERLGERYAFRVFTADRDLGDARPYPGVVRGEWQHVGHADVYYSRPWNRSLLLMHELRRLRPAVVYANGTYGRMTRRYILLRVLHLVPNSPVVIAPRGEMSPGAIQIKAWKKRPYLALIRSLPFLSYATWHACADHEASDMASVLGSRRQVVVARNMAGRGDDGGRGFHPKRAGEARFLFLSRLSPIKNLVFLLECLGAIRGRVTLTIAGPAEDQTYWKQCEAVIARLPRNISVERIGPVEHSKVRETMSSHSFFVLPTLSENYGHVVQEALAGGCPAVLSDRTPWRELESKGIGWDLPLRRERWETVLQKCVDMDEQQHARMAAAARAFAGDEERQRTAVTETDLMLQRAIASARAR